MKEKTSMFSSVVGRSLIRWGFGRNCCPDLWAKAKGDGPFMRPHRMFRFNLKNRQSAPPLHPN